MILKLTQHGDDLALVIGKSLLEQLNIDSDTPLEMRTDGKTLIVVPAHRADREARFAAALESVNREYGRALKLLAE